jgi:hypothetical protein
MPDDRVAHKEFAETMLEKLDKDNKCLRKIMLMRLYSMFQQR